MAVNTFVLAVDTAVSGSWVAAAAWNTALATKPPWPRGAGPQAPRSGSCSQQWQHWRRVCAWCCSHVGTIPSGCCSSEAPQEACWVLAAHRSESCSPCSPWWARLAESALHLPGLLQPAILPGLPPRPILCQSNPSELFSDWKTGKLYLCWSEWLSLCRLLQWLRFPWFCYISAEIGATLPLTNAQVFSDFLHLRVLYGSLL